MPFLICCNTASLLSHPVIGGTGKRRWMIFADLTMQTFKIARSYHFVPNHDLIASPFRSESSVHIHELFHIRYRSGSSISSYQLLTSQLSSLQKKKNQRVTLYHLCILYLVYHVFSYFLNLSMYMRKMFIHKL